MSFVDRMNEIERLWAFIMKYFNEHVWRETK